MFCLMVSTGALILAAWEFLTCPSYPSEQIGVPRTVAEGLMRIVCHCARLLPTLTLHDVFVPNRRGRPVQTPCKRTVQYCLLLNDLNEAFRGSDLVTEQHDRSLGANR